MFDHNCTTARGKELPEPLKATDGTLGEALKLQCAGLGPPNINSHGVEPTVNGWLLVGVPI